MINAYLEARPSMMYCPFTLYGMNATGLNVALYDGLMLRKKKHKKKGMEIFFNPSTLTHSFPANPIQ